MHPWFWLSVAWATDPSPQRVEVSELDDFLWQGHQDATDVLLEPEPHHSCAGVKVPAKGWTFPDCPGKTRLAPGGTFTLVYGDATGSHSVTLALAEADAAKDVTLSALPDKGTRGEPVWIYLPEVGWRTAKLAAAGLDTGDPEVGAALKKLPENPDGLVMRMTNAGHLVQRKLVAQPPPVVTEPSDACGALAAADATVADAKKSAYGLRNSRVLCLDFADQSTNPLVFLGAGKELGVGHEDWPKPDTLADGRHVGDSLSLLPNEWLTVVVVNAPGQTTAAMSTVGKETEDVVKVESVLPPPNSPVEAKSASSTGKVAVQVFHVAPRPMGTVWTLTLTSGAEKAQRVRSIEVEVDNVYVGAVRIGVGIGSTFVAEPDYTTVSWPGTGGSTVVNLHTDDASSWRPEIVLGYAGFPTPRSYALGSAPRTLDQMLAPYIGLGLVGWDGESLQPLTSVYGGLEIEPIHDFGITLTGMLRRGEKLNSPYAVGELVSSTANLTSMTIRPGFALVVNVSPAFFRAHPALTSKLTKAPDASAAAGAAAKPAADASPKPAATGAAASASPTSTTGTTK